MRRSGFALLEVVLVVGIIGIIGSMSVPLYRDYQIRNDLNLATEQVTQGVARARLLSQSAQDDSGWGFYIPSGTLYKGDSYAERDQGYDESYPMPSTIMVTGLTEVSYSKVGGIPSSTGAINLIALNQEQRTIFIKVENESIAIVEEEDLVICHSPPGNPGNKETITINESAWPAHRDNHGDTLGPCPAVASSSAASSQNSSINSSLSAAASSVASGGGAGSSAPATCEDRFSVAADGTITTTGPLSIRFDSLGAQFGYGNGGPDVPVRVAYRKKNSGGWTKLFDNDAINGTGGDTETVTNFQNGDKVILRFWAKYGNRGWLSYDRQIFSNDGSKDILVLRNGDTAPTVSGADGQVGISTLLQSITSNGQISIGTYDAVLIGDFNRQDCSSCSNNYCSNCDGVDYQDGVVLVKFLTPSC